MPNSELEFANSFDNFFSKLPDTRNAPAFGGISEPPGASVRLAAAEEKGLGFLIEDERKKQLFNQYVKGLVHPLKAHRSTFAEHAVNEIKDPAERAWLTDKVREFSKAKKDLRSQRDAKAGFLQKAGDIAREAVLSPLEGMAEVKEAFFGPNRPLGLLAGKGRLSEDQVSFRRGLESAKVSEDPLVQKEAGLLRRGISGAGRMVPDLAAGGLSFAAGGPTALAAYSALRATPGAVEQSQEMGLSGPAAATAGGAIGLGVGLLETAGSIDPTGLLKKASSPLQRAGRKALIEFAQKTFPKAAARGEKALAGKLKTEAALKEAAEYFYRGALEVGEEGSQAAWEESVNVASSILSDNVDPREKWSVPGAFVDAVKESAIPIALIGTAGPIVKSIEGRKSIEDLIRKHQKDGTVPSRKEWKEISDEKATSEQRKESVAQIVEELDIQDSAAKQLEAAETPEPPQATLEAPVQQPVDTQQAKVPENANEQQAVPEALVAQEPRVDIDLAADLNKAAGQQWRSEAGLPPLEGPGVRSFEQVLGEVLSGNMQKDAVRNAKSIIDDVNRNKSPRLTTDREHAAMMVRTQELLSELDRNRDEQYEASEQNATGNYRLARAAEVEIINDLDTITSASQFSGTEVARALNIRKLRSSREDFSAEGVLNRFRKAKGSDLSTSEKQSVANATREYSQIEKQAIQQEMEDSFRRDNREKAFAKKLLEENSGKGRSIRKAAEIEIEDIKSEIRALGHQVHDVIPLTVEGFYLVGRLGIAYAKSGVGSITEIVEKLKSDMREFDMSDQEIYQAITARDPKRKIKQRSEAEKKVRDVKTAAKILLNIDRMANGIAPEVTKRTPTSPEIKKLQKEFTKARDAFYKTDIEASKIEKAIDTINHLQDQLKKGERAVKRSRAEVPTELHGLRQQISELRSEIRIEDEITRLDKQIQSGEFTQPKKTVKKQISRKLENKQVELAKKRQEIRELVEDARPLDLKRRAKSVAAELKAIAATADMSFTMRQNLWQMFSHPVRNLSPFKRSLGAFFSEHSSQEIANSLRNSQNADLYELSGLSIMDPGSPESQNRSEVFRGRIIENLKIPWTNIQNPFGKIMTASSRHSVAIGNLVRSSAFDFFLEKNPNATQVEMRAMADYINKSTGLGDIGRATAVLQEVMFSPKFAASRFQTPWTVVKYWQQPRVRKAIATDMVRMGSTGMLILTLAGLAGAGVEWKDLNSPDWGKIRIGDTRYDIFGGFLQPTRLLMRLSTGPFAGAEDFKNFDPWEMIGRFSAYKAAPALSIPIEFLTNKTIVGEDTTKIETIGRSMRPLIIGEIKEAWQSEGLAGAAAVAPFAFLGGGAATYSDSWSAAKRRRDNFKSRWEHRRAAEVVREFNRSVKEGGRRLADR